MRYPYRCPECHVTEDVEAPIEEGPKYAPICVICSIFNPEPGFVYMKRVWSAVPAIFRGGGWAGKS
jgi:hypothetical protein